MLVTSGKYYLYRHIRKDKNEPFYIGIGTSKNPECKGKTRYERSYSKQRNKIWKDITNKTEWEVEILLESDNYDFILEKEIEFIILYGRIDLGTGILSNLNSGGKGNYNTIASEYKKDRMSKLRKGKVPPNKGVPCSEAVKLQISQTLLGRKASKEQIEKSVRIRKEKAQERGYFMSEEQKKSIGLSNSKLVFQYSLNGDFLGEFASRHVASEETGVNPETIWRWCAKKVTKPCKHTKYIWSYDRKNI